MPNDFKKISELDDKLVNIINDFTFLSNISWSKEANTEFIKNLKKGKYKLPKVKYENLDYSEKINSLKDYLRELGNDHHSAIKFLRDTAQSYLTAYLLLQNVGTSSVNELSKELYGSPKDVVTGHKRTNLGIAKYFIRVVDKYKTTIEDEPLIHSAKEFAKLLKKQISQVIDIRKDPIDIIIDSKINARAAAGSNYVKLRKGARFSNSDLSQLINHEVFTHTLTFINGRKQQNLKSLGYASPRITSTQEGLAVFSEYITSSIELVRLKRIALRIIAIDMAEDGADLIDLYRFFKNHGQNDEESYFSSMRILRGGFPEGGIVFYKDNIYLRGLLEIEEFLKRTMHRGNLDEIDILFSGKLTTKDAEDLKELANQGFIEKPRYKPLWAKNLGELAAHLAINDITEKFREKSHKS